MNVADMMGLGPVIPVLVMDDAAHGRPIAATLAAGDLPARQVIAGTAKVEGAAWTPAPDRTKPDRLPRWTRTRFVVGPGLTTRGCSAHIKVG